MKHFPSLYTVGLFFENHPLNMPPRNTDMIVKKISAQILQSINTVIFNPFFSVYGNMGPFPSITLISPITNRCAG